MNIPLLLLNILYYGLAIWLYSQAKHDPSISLGIGFMFIALWIVFPILQFILWRTKVIKVTTLADKIGMVTVTPLLSIITFTLLANIDRAEARSSTFEYNKNGYRYQEIYYDYSGLAKTRKIAFYRSEDTVSEAAPFPETDKWVKDSVWVYLSKAGDTVRKEHYRNDTLIKRYGG